MNKKKKQNRDRLIEYRLTALGQGWEVEGSTKKEKGLMDMANSGVIKGVRGVVWSRRG